MTDIEGSPPAQRCRLEEIVDDTVTTLVSNNTRADMLSITRFASCGPGVMRLVLGRIEEMKLVLGLPCVMEQAVHYQYMASEQEQALSDKYTITPLYKISFLSA